jgi:hypothetical protein
MNPRNAGNAVFRNSILAGTVAGPRHGSQPINSEATGSTSRFADGQVEIVSSRFFEIAFVVVRFDHVARFIVKPNRSIV